MLLQLSLPVWALDLETLVIEGSLTGLSLHASDIIPLNHVVIISGEKLQNIAFSEPVF